MWQWASMIIGAAAAQAVGGNAQTGASTAVSGTKNNKLNEYEITEFKQELITALANDASAEAIQGIIARYKAQSMDERAFVDWWDNLNLGFGGSTNELNNETKEFLKDQLGFDWDEAFSIIKGYKPDATDADVWDNLYEHVKTNEGAIVYRANKNKEALLEASGPVSGDTLLSLGKVSSINWESDGIARSVTDSKGETRALETYLSRGDYEYKQGKEPFPDIKTNRWYGLPPRD